MHKICLLLFFFHTFASLSQYTLIPDVNFENTLISYGYDDIQDGQVQTSNISSVTSLYLLSANISDLSGIEDFQNLSYLDASFNSLTTIDLSQNTQLTTLNLISNTISFIDLSQNIFLTDIDLNNNPLLQLDLSNNSLLSILNVASTELTSLDLSANIALTELYCCCTPILELDLSMLTNLNEIQAFTMDNLSCLNLKNGNNMNMSTMGAYWNYNLTCITVDDVNWATANWTTSSMNISSHNYFSENCADFCTAELPSNSIAKLEIFPNPFSDVIEIKNLPETTEWLFIKNLQGVLIEKIPIYIHVPVQLNHLSKGIYIISFEGIDDQLNYRVIKQ